MLYLWVSVVLASYAVAAGVTFGILDRVDPDTNHRDACNTEWAALWPVLIVMVVVAAPVIGAVWATRKVIAKIDQRRVAKAIPQARMVSK